MSTQSTQAANGAAASCATVRRGAGDVLLLLVLGTLAIAFAPLLHTANPVLAILTQSLIACAIALVLPGYAVGVAIFTLLFQNIFVSVMSPIIAAADLEVIKGYNFLCCAVMWATIVAQYLVRWRTAPVAITSLMVMGFAVMAVIGVYFLVGFRVDAVPSIIYLRNFIFPLFMFQLALLTASSYRASLTRALIALGVLMALCGYVEFFFRDFWLDVTNGHAYWHFDEVKALDSGVWEKEMRATGNVPVDLKDRFKFDFLNTPLLEGLGLEQSLRVFGPNISAISFAYGVAFFVLFLLSTRRYLLATCILPLMVLCGVKGALIMTLFVVAGWLGTVLIGALPTLIAGSVAGAIYAALGIRVGLQIGDYHVIGFMGGWNGFVQWPFGRGLGVGGNLGGDFAAIDWSAAQSAGAVDGAVESAVGVMLFQMGLAALVPLAFYAFVGVLCWRRYRQSLLPPQGFAAFGLLITLVNGIFQEEALFAPLALGMMMTMAGLVLGHAVRAEAAAERASATRVLQAAPA